MMLEDVNNINIESLEDYLNKDSWKQDLEYKNTKVKLFKKIIENEEYSLIIPSSDRFKDAKIRINDALQTMSAIKGKNVNYIINDILRVKVKDNVVLYKPIIKQEKDILSIRIISKLSQNGTIPLEYGSNIVDGLRKLILSAIFTEENAKPYFLKTSKNSYEKLSKYKLAQTAVGSYIFNIEIDSQQYEQIGITDQGEMESTISEERKVIRRIQNGIRDIKEKDINELFKDGYKKGLNANMCDALMNLNIDNATDIKIESKVKWSDLGTKPTDIVEKVVLEKSDFYIVKAVAEKYKETNDVECSIEGKIIRLSNRRNLHGNTIERNIVIQTEVDGKYKNVTVELGANDYIKACEAHKQDNDISISGKLSKKGKIWVINNSRNFKVL